MQKNIGMISNFSFNKNCKTISGTIKNSILKHLIENGSFIIPEISESTGYSLTTISKYVSELVKEDFLIEKEKISLHTKGRKAISYSMHPDSCYFLGVDIRAFDLRIRLINFMGEEIKSIKNDKFILENSYETFEYVCIQIKEFIQGIEGIDEKKILSANINLPGRVNHKEGTSSTLFNFEETHYTPLSEIFTEKIGIKVYIENDTKAMAYGEYICGKDKRNFKDVIYVNIGWGLGLGIIIDGKLYHGKNGYSGEFGHNHAYSNNILCHCGKKECIETEVSARAIQRKIIEKINSGEQSILSKKVKKGITITTNHILEAAELEDPLCIELISQTGTELGHHLAGIINIFNPEAIIIGGHLSQAEPYCFLQPIELAIRKYSLKLMNQNVSIISSELGANAGVYGACLIARNITFFGEGTI